MSEQIPRITWGVERRLRFIEFRLYWEGGVRRGDIISTFGVSEPQASKDLSLYQERAPGNAVYDKVGRRYVAGSGSRPVFLEGGPSDYLLRLRSYAEAPDGGADTWLGTAPDVDTVLNPAREIDANCLRTLLRAVREQRSLEVFYQSMSRERPDPTWRRITPHAFGYDGFRWHARAFCHATGAFKDFLIPRVTGVRHLDGPGRPGGDDDMWNERFDVVVVPHPDLGPNQRAIVEKDYGMVGGSKVMSIRHAMLFYSLRRLHLLGRPEDQPARSQHIVVRNREETDAAVRRADWSVR